MRNILLTFLLMPAMSLFACPDCNGKCFEMEDGSVKLPQVKLVGNKLIYTKIHPDLFKHKDAFLENLQRAGIIDRKSDVTFYEPDLIVILPTAKYLNRGKKKLPAKEIGKTLSRRTQPARDVEITVTLPVMSLLQFAQLCRIKDVHWHASQQ
jgi:hypothetical protein